MVFAPKITDQAVIPVETGIQEVYEKAIPLDSGWSLSR
jgi:hypothetical protein